MDGIPHSVKILEQPMEFGYRFRYVVEGKAHGGLQGNSTKAGGKRGSKVFPEIQIMDVPSEVDDVHIEARLVSATEEFKPHPNKCSGKDCNERGIFRRTLKRAETPEFKMVMSNLTVLQIKKGDQKKSLLDQLTDIAEDRSSMGFNIPTNPTNLNNDAEELSKTKHNGVVRIRFQASYYDPMQGRWKQAFAHSTPIHDQKQTSAAELRIVRISHTACPVTGSDEIYLLCEKVHKEDIKLKFKKDKWEAEGKFAGQDVHYQYAVVFKAPPYKDQDIRKAVKVDLMLFRPSTGTYSKPIEFTYHPTQTDEEQVARKRKKPSGPSDMGGYPPHYMPHMPHNFGGSGGGGGGGGGGGNPPGGYGSPYGGGYNYKTAPKTSNTVEMEVEEAMDLTKRTSGENDNIPITIDEVEHDHVSNGDDDSIEVEDVEADSSLAVKTEAAEEAASVKAEPETDEADDDLQADGAIVKPRHPMDHIIGYKPATPEMMKCEKPLSSQTEVVGKFSAVPKDGKIRDGGKTRAQRVTKPDDESSQLTEELELQKTRLAGIERHVSVCEDLVVESLMNYAITGNHLYFLSQFRFFLGVKDEYGDNSLHMAVINEQYKALADMLGICKATNSMLAVNQTNDKLQTPLHVATIMQNQDMVDTLLEHGADPTIVDRRGNTCFHIASKNKDFKTLALLCRWIVTTGKNLEQIDELNYSGYSPLHHAVQSDSVDCMRELIEAGADVNKGDGTSGRTPLHHAVIQSSIIATAELALRVRADVNAQAFDGNTALHLAISLNNTDLSKMLIKSGANPDIKNREWYQDYDEEELSDDDEVADGKNAFDMCKTNLPMLEVIQNAMKKETKPTFHGGIGSIQSLSDMTKRELSRLLDKESKDWKRLAKLCELGPTVVEYLQEKSAPTICLLDYLASEKTINDLKENLRKISRMDCIDVLEKRSTMPSIKDSGFDSEPMLLH